MKPTTPSRPPRPPLKPTSSTTSWTTPHNTDVILYEYLWRAEHARGLEAGRKVRPCLVMATYDYRGRLRVITAPLTTRDFDPKAAVEIPQAVKAHLKLDDRARIIWNDLNEFSWVGPDVRTGQHGTPYLGRVPQRLWEMVRAKAVAAGVRPVMRSE